MSKRKIAAFIAVGLCVLGRFVPEPEPVKKEAAAAPTAQAEKVLTFEGLPLAGSADLAAKLGFTECTPEWNSQLVCAKAGAHPTVLGVKATSVAVVLRDHSPDASMSTLDGKSLEDLTFTQLRYEFAEARYDSVCTESKATYPTGEYAPDACALPDTLAALHAALKREGWISSGRYSRNERVVRPDQHVSLHFSRNALTVEAVTPDVMADVLARDAAYRKAKKTDAEELADKMATKGT